MSSYTVRDWVTVGLFGALWGVVEMTLGSALHQAFPAQANTVLTGPLLAGIGVLVALTGRHFVRRRGSVWWIGVVAALLKLLSPGGATVGAIVAILMEGLLMEVMLSIARGPRLWAFVSGGALAVAWNLPHKFVMMRVVYGKAVEAVYLKMVEDVGRVLGGDAPAGWLALIILLGIYGGMGAAGGWGAWRLAGAVARRLGRSDKDEEEP